jgi:hypothetical protein
MDPAWGPGLAPFSSLVAALAGKEPLELLGKISPEWLGIPQVDMP